MLRSRPRPEANSNAVAPLTTIPAAATQIMTPLFTGAGSASRSTASHAIPPVTTSRITALVSAARIEVEPRP